MRVWPKILICVALPVATGGACQSSRSSAPAAGGHPAPTAERDVSTGEASATPSADKALQRATDGPRDAVTILGRDEIPTDRRRYPYNHAATIGQGPDGELLVAWGAGSRELGPDTVILLSRRPAAGGSWSTPIVVADKPNFADANPVLFVDDRGVVWLYHVEMYGPEFCTGRIAARSSSDGGQTWSRPSRPLPALCTMVRHHVLITRGGRWVLPAYQQALYQSNFWLSDDRGRTWRGTKPLLTLPSNNLQPAVVEMDDGSLLGMARSTGPDFHTWQLRSFDGGQSWDARQRSELPNPNSGLELSRLANGALLLFFNPSRDERTPLAVSISRDDGASWSEPQTLADGPPQLSYPSAVQTTDGTIHLVYSHRLTSIRHVHLSVR
jgi:predicted neuraminidase